MKFLCYIIYGRFTLYSQLNVNQNSFFILTMYNYYYFTNITYKITNRIEIEMTIRIEI